MPKVNIGHDELAGPTGPKQEGGRRHWALGELSLVEHALCPLDVRSTAGPLLHRTSYWYFDKHRNRKKATASVKAVDGLSANDELYLWGILGIIFSQPEPGPNLFATRNYILRRLGFSVGGANYVTLRGALDRLAGAKYRNDKFYDPIRGEHRQVAFGFLSYSLPADPKSQRAWQIAIDPLFYSLLEPLKAHFWFDLEIYRSLDAASRRLYLILKKVFHHRNVSPRWELRDLAVNVLGYAPSLQPKELRKKIRECGERLVQVGVVEPGKELFHGTGRKTYVQFQRGMAAKQAPRQPVSLPLRELPIYEQWVAIGVDEPGMGYLKRNYPMPLLQEWADITLAAKEHHGPKFFDRSMAAFYIDNVKAAKSGGRRPPDWWYEFRKREQELTSRQQQDVSPAKASPCRRQFAQWIRCEGRSLFETTFREILDLVAVDGRAREADATVARRETEARLWQEFVARKAIPKINS
jgi:hypothetical protein